MRSTRSARMRMGELRGHDRRSWWGGSVGTAARVEAGADIEESRAEEG